jgi:hypothetical protein
MPGLKPTTINASFFPEADDNGLIENTGGDGQPQKRSKWPLKRGKSAAGNGKVLRDLGDDGETTRTTPPSTQPSTRRSSVTRVGDSVSLFFPLFSMALFGLLINLGILGAHT